MRFSLLITSPPHMAASKCAIDFCNATLRNGHTLHRAFFLADGVLNSTQDSILLSSWQTLIQENQIDAVCCINSAQEYGLVDKHGYTKNKDSLFSYSGLGQLIEASIKSERIITFGQR